MELAEQPVSTGSEAAAPATASDTPNAAQQTLPEGTADASHDPTPDDPELAALLPEDDGTEEIEWEGKKHKIPAELKSALMAHADYTRKTQEVAEQKKAIEANAADLQRQAEFQRQHLQELAAVVSIDNQLAEYDKLDWPTLIAQNPQQAMLLDQQRRDLQGRRSQIAQTLAHKEQQEGLKAQQARAARIEQAQRELQTRIRGWSPEVASQLTSYGRKAGFPDAVLSPEAPVPFVEVLHKAMQWDQLIAKRTAKPQSTPAKPVTKVSGAASPATKDPNNMNADEWRKWREAQVTGKKKR